MVVIYKQGFAENNFTETEANISTSKFYKITQ